jgi:hypothetical protein
MKDWIESTEQLPICFELGHWDGKQSDLVIGETNNGKQFIGRCYEGVMDGVNFFDWYQVDEINNNDWLINDTVVRWMKIPF